MRILGVIATLCAIVPLIQSRPVLAADQPLISLMPKPAHMTRGTGLLVVGKGFTIHLNGAADDEAVRSGAARLAQELQRSSRTNIAIDKHRSAGGITVVVGRRQPVKIGVDESYSLVVSASGARLDAPTSIGALRGLATLRQLVVSDAGHTVLPAVSIEDAPLYKWRGLMIDCARHFVPIETLEHTLDAMELTKLNVLHLHLSDNEGFRLQSKVFPELTGKGSNGQFYTQQQMRELIRQAALRGIIVVPEFDMPSHSKSWFAGYPDLASAPGPYTPGPLSLGNLPPKASFAEIVKAAATAPTPAFDPSRESTYTFLDRFFDEMTKVFPSPYFHIGADENNGAIWRANPSITAFMRAHHLKDTTALQAYFVDRVHTLLSRHGRTMVAWEEAWAPDAKPGAIYQVWSPMAKVNLLKTPIAPEDKLLVSKGFYLDIFFPAYAHYMNDALPSSSPPSPLLGGEAAMWTELEDRNDIESRLWPRTGVIAERLWTPGKADSAEDVYARMFHLGTVLDAAGVAQLREYHAGVARLAAGGPTEPVQTLLDVLTPLKGYKRLMSRVGAMQNPNPPPLTSAADVALVDSAAKYQFRAAVAGFLAHRNADSAAAVRTWLERWKNNWGALQPVAANSKDLAAVAGHAERLAALASFALDQLPTLEQGIPLSQAQTEQADRLIKDAQRAEGQTELAVVPELAGLLHGRLDPEPVTWPLF